MTAQLVQGMPKVELHRHLEGSMRPATILDMFRNNLGMYRDTPLEAILPKVQVTGDERSLPDFLAKFEFFMGCIKSAGDITRITTEVIADCSAEGIIHSELRFSPAFIRQLTGLGLMGAVEAVLEGAREVPSGMSVSFILGSPQPQGPRVAWDTVRIARDYMTAGVRGVDISDDTRIVGLGEYQAPIEWAKSEGLGVTIHAGEAEGPESVRTAIERLGATRIGHGIRAIEDSKVVRLAVERDVTLEVCPTSNIHTAAARSYETHPLPRLLDCGVKVTLNTDDPGISGITLGHEYGVATEKWGMGREDLLQMNLTAAAAAFVDDGRRRDIVAALEAWGRCPR
jgi:adenosine deaminase